MQKLESQEKFWREVSDLINPKSKGYGDLLFCLSTIKFDFNSYLTDDRRNSLADYLHINDSDRKKTYMKNILEFLLIMDYCSQIDKECVREESKILTSRLKSIVVEYYVGYYKENGNILDCLSFDIFYIKFKDQLDSSLCFFKVIMRYLSHPLYFVNNKNIVDEDLCEIVDIYNRFILLNYEIKTAFTDETVVDMREFDYSSLEELLKKLFEKSCELSLYIKEKINETIVGNEEVINSCNIPLNEKNQQINEKRTTLISIRDDLWKEIIKFKYELLDFLSNSNNEHTIGYGWLECLEAKLDENIRMLLNENYHIKF